ncbi:DUF6355 family natural product biosynthesis protein [Amycolatopsis pigmentata]|uniref:DUF6355 family natural product biosynthesis protein n=1 Tax=Amycolatopsis pigmentata TaxID=450801 RepID=A0ABW5FK51_9PSEU
MRTKKRSAARLVTGILVGLLALSGLLVNGGTAVAAPGQARDDQCGYIPMGQYRHCDNGSGSTVMLDVQDVFFGIHHYCVGPGLHNIQPGIRWRVVYAWWNGGVGCAPGFYGP